MLPRSSRRRPAGRLGIACTLLVLGGCAGPAKLPPEPAGPIPWTAAIGQLDVPSESSSCTATLVAPATIVTAAHCIFPKGEKLPAAAMTFTPNAGAQRLPAVRIAEIVGLGVERMNPDKPEETPTELDWAVLRLESPITNIAPIPVEPVALAEIDRRIQTGQTLSSFGYGRYGFTFGDHLYRNDGCKLIPEWQQLVSEANDRLVMTTCLVVKGDSGGPLLIGGPNVDRRLIAVVSRYWRRPDGTVSLAVGASAFADRLKVAVDAQP
jgi:V8-like Glu-specific endopeptidase